MSLRVKTESFEGPFDLLLELVSRQKVDIGSIAIAQIADQYLEEISRMEMLDLDVAGDFLVVASTLLEIKAQSLLPKPLDELETELAELNPNDARAILIERLLAYKQYKNAAAHFADCAQAWSKLHGRPFGPDESFAEVMPDYLADVTLDSLALTCAQLMARKEVFLLESEHIAAKPIPVEMHVRAIHQRLKNKKNVMFSELLAKDTPIAVVVVTFLAVLELYKRGMVKVEQKKNFGDIKISYIEGSGDLSFEGEDALTSFE
ncbi:MAG: segregation/condensation protein A [Eggerthellaceae bacterium]|nr:segregation/condensation protein A [Eggerthellaceae bacterium]